MQLTEERPAATDRPEGATHPSTGLVTTPRLRWGKAVRWMVLLATLTLVVRMGLRGWNDIRAAAAAMSASQLHVIGLVVVLQVAWAWSLAQISRTALLAVGGRVTRRQALRISMAGFTLSRVVPSGGAAGSVFAARELTLLGNPAPVSLAGMAVSWAISITTLVSLVLVAATVAVAADDLPATALLPAAGVLSALVGAGVVTTQAMRKPLLRRRTGRLLERGLRRVGISMSAAAWDEPLEAVAVNLRKPRRLIPVVAWSTVAWMVDATALWLMFWLFGYSVPIGDAALGYGFGNLLSALPELTPGWLGVYEASVAATFVRLGAPSGVAIAAVMGYRLTGFWLPVAAGVVPVVKSLSQPRAERLGRGAAPKALSGMAR